MLVPAAVLWRVSALVEQRLGTIAADVEALVSAARGEEARRPVLVGAPLQGSAWPEYEAALAELPQTKLQDIIHETVASIPSSRVEHLVTTHRAALDHLALGTRHEDGQYPYEWSAPASTRLVSLGKANDLIELVLLQARRSREAGDAKESITWLLRGCQFSRDLGHNGHLFSESTGAWGVGECLEDLADIVASEEIGAASLSQLAAQLELLEEQLPTWSRGRRNHALFLGVAVQDACASGTWSHLLAGGIESAGWRYLCSNSLMATEAWPVNRDLAAIVAGADGRSWSETRALLAAKSSEMKASDNPILRWLGHDSIVGRCADLRRALAMVRLLRVAVVLRATGERLDLADPFGDRLRWSPEKVWSVGPDGIDGGGRGDFAFASKDPDLVLQVQH